jgi:hypothetical protein
MPIGEYPAQARDLHAQTSFLDDHVRPDPRIQFALGDHLSRVLDEQDQDVELARADWHGRITLQQQAFGREEPKRTELPAIAPSAHLRILP